MAKCMGVAGESGDLFGEPPIPRREATTRGGAPELKTAYLLCRQLRHQRARQDKQRIAHLICLNLQLMLRHNSLPAQVSGEHKVSKSDSL